MTDFHSIESKIASAEAARPLYKFAIPAKLAKQTGVRHVRLIELKSSEEQMATRRAQSTGDQLALAVELVKESIRFVNDDRMSTGDGSADTWWGTAAPGFSKVRQLLMSAYMDIHNPSKDDSESFLSSMAIEVR